MITTAPTSPALSPRHVWYTGDDGDRYAHVLRAEIRERRGGTPSTIRHEPTPDPVLELSISGEIWPATAAWSVDRRRVEADSYGQNLDALRSAVIYDRIVTPNPEALSATDAHTVARIWGRWHLNGMRALCAHQSRAGWRCTRTGAYAYAVARDPWTCAECGRSRWDCEPPCLAVPDSHPFELARLVGPVPERRRDALARRVCACGAAPAAAVHGYRPGSGWLVEPLPAGVLDDVARIFGARP
jgi:hypothetical protein